MSPLPEPDSRRTPARRRSTKSRRLRQALLTGVGTLVVATVAWAASFKHVGTHVTSKSPDEAWGIMTAYSDTCDSGCKYSRPSLVEVRKVKYARKDSSWYTWSHIASPIKDAKYFTEVTITRKSDGNFIAENRQLTDKDDALIKKLESSTGLKHSPVFDGGGTTTITRLEGKNTVLTQTMTVYTGALVGLWAGKIRSEMKKNMEATFDNIGK